MKSRTAERHVSGLLVLVVAIVGLGPGSARAQTPRNTAVRSAPAATSPASDREAFDRAVDRLPAETWRTVAPARVAPVWDLLDALIARRLNAAIPLDEINAELATLHRFEVASRGTGERIRGTLDWSELPADLPGWFVGAVPQLGEDQVLGLYNLGLGAPGRATLFTLRDGIWTASGRIAATLPLSLTPVPGGSGSLGLLAVERSTAEARSECRISLWRATAGQLRRDQVLPGSYLDCDVAASESAVLLTYGQLPAALTTGALGPRLLSETALTLQAGRWKLVTRPLNPWLHFYERFYRAGGGATARAIVSRSSLLRGLSRRVLDDGGDAGGGSGWILVEDARGQRLVEMEVGDKGVWQVVRVVSAADSMEQP